jgi:hypothetical protein
MGDANNTVPEPFVFAPSQAWDGNDGAWSTFIVRVGTPEQTFRVLPSIIGQETFIPVPEGCTDSDPSNCGERRGVYPFNGEQGTGFLTNASSSWKSIGLFNLILGHDVDMTGNGLYGFDTVGLMLPNSGGLTLETQIVAGIATKDFYLGVFGLSPKPSNFTDFDYPQPSFLGTLKNQSKIPSLSFAYTAGAAYRIPKLPGSLTLGGYDSSRFTQNEQSFPFSADDSKVLSVGIQRITAQNTLQGSVSPLNSQILTVIDSTTPHIWLPRSACDSLQKAFGLTYDNSTDLYIVNETSHDKLLELNPTITFSLGNENDVAKMVTIELPYSAFDLQASSPIYDTATNYFPIRRAANDTQYTLGRTFLQEAYVIADYERKNFSVHQALFESPMPDQNIVALYPPLDTNNNTTLPSSSSGGLPKGAAIGIGVGVGALALIAILFAFFFFRRRRAAKKKAEEEAANAGPHQLEDKNRFELYTNPTEIHSAGPGESKNAWEMQADTKHAALMSDDAATPTRHEMDGDGQKLDVRHEMPGGPQKQDGYFGEEVGGVIRHEMPAEGDKGALRHELGTGTNEVKPDEKWQQMHR